MIANVRQKEFTISSHSVPINNQASIEMKAVVMSIVDVDGVHSFLELLLRNNFTDVFQDKFSRLQRLSTSHTPAFLLRHKTFQSLGPVMALDTLIHTFITNWAMLYAALRVHHPVNTVVTTERAFISYYSQMTLFRLVSNTNPYAMLLPQVLI